MRAAIPSGRSEWPVGFPLASCSASDRNRSLGRRDSRKALVMKNDAVKEEPAWHALAETEVVRLLDVDLQQGLSTEEVRARQLQYGPNRLSARRGVPGWRR